MFGPAKRADLNLKPRPIFQSGLIKAIRPPNAAQNSLPRRLPLSREPAIKIADRRPGSVLEIEIRERLPSGVPHDEARVVVLIERPRWREAARGGHGAMMAWGYRGGCGRDCRRYGLPAQPGIYSLVSSPELCSCCLT